jgi:uncharacterized protein YggE
VDQEEQAGRPVEELISQAVRSWTKGLHYVALFSLEHRMRLTAVLMALGIAGAAAAGYAQGMPQTAGTLVIVPADGEVTQANDEAHVMFMVDEQDRDKAVAASHANLKMKQGTDILKREDAQAVLQTRGYYTYPVYADEPPKPNAKSRPIIGWRVVQYLEMKTAELSRLPKTVSAAQTVLALNGLQFGLSEAATKKLDSRRIEAAYRNLGERVASIARAMGRNLADASIETVDFEASGAYAQEASAKRAMLAQTTGVRGMGPQMEEPNFEPGETTLNMRIVGKVRFK